MPKFWVNCIKLKRRISRLHHSEIVHNDYGRNFYTAKLRGPRNQHRKVENWQSKEREWRSIMYDPNILQRNVYNNKDKMTKLVNAKHGTKWLKIGRMDKTRDKYLIYNDNNTKDKDKRTEVDPQNKKAIGIILNEQITQAKIPHLEENWQQAFCYENLQLY